jgi:hypothetical protein
MIVQGQASGVGTSIAIPAHQPGDLIFVFARRASNTPPTIPAAGGTVPTWVTAQSAGSNTLALTSVSAKATASNHTTGAFTNASHICVLVLRPDAGKSLVVGPSATLFGSNNQAIVYPLLALGDTDGSSWGVRVGTRGVAVATVGNPPTNWVNQIIQPAGAGALMAVHTRAGLVANPTQDTVSTTGTNAPNRANTIEVQETTAPKVVSIV